MTRHGIKAHLTGPDGGPNTPPNNVEQSTSDAPETATRDHHPDGGASPFPSIEDAIGDVVDLIVKYRGWAR